MCKADVVFIYTMIIIITEISDSGKYWITWAVGVAHEIFVWYYLATFMSILLSLASKIAEMSTFKQRDRLNRPQCDL